MRFEPALRPDVQFATLYDATDKPVASVARRRVRDRTAPAEWAAYDTDGRLIGHADNGVTIRRMVRAYLAPAYFPPNPAACLAAFHAFRHAR